MEGSRQETRTMTHIQFGEWLAGQCLLHGRCVISAADLSPYFPGPSPLSDPGFQRFCSFHDLQCAPAPNGFEFRLRPD